MFWNVDKFKVVLRIFIYQSNAFLYSERTQISSKYIKIFLHVKIVNRDRSSMTRNRIFLEQERRNLLEILSRTTKAKFNRVENRIKMYTKRKF